MEGQDKGYLPALSIGLGSLVAVLDELSVKNLAGTDRDEPYS